MEWIKDYMFLIPLFPLLGFLFNGINAFFQDRIFGKERTKYLVAVVGPSVVFVSFVLSVIAFLYMMSFPPEERALIPPSVAYTWLGIGNLKANIAFIIDPLSLLMALIVTGVGFLIHVYSIGYMWEDEHFSRYFTYLNLFVFSMTLLILGDNILLMFVGWEGVGLCSYLLIGFWYRERPNAIAGMKAFIVNRVGDYGFLIGIFLLFWGAVYFNTGNPMVSFKQLPDVVKGMPEWYKTIIGICLFIGATGKSAQIPLYVWLPDAMAGPTPVSALIHAATMVTSGVYMIGRLNFLYSQAPVALTVVAIIAVLTAFFAATIGMTQFDIKKVLAYSTVSQLGYMFLGMGVGAYSAGIFHLMTHAFFKGLLFLGSGSVILAMHHEQDMRKMGGLRKKIPITFWTFFIATLAISGVPGFSGFFSKDEILWKAFSNKNIVLPWLPPVLWAIGTITAGLTAFYMFRLLFMTFYGEFRGDKHTWEHMKESPKTMTIPLIILAILSFAGGYVGMSEVFGVKNLFHHYLEPVLKEPEFVKGEHFSHAVEFTLMGISVLVAFIGIGTAYYLYIVRPELPDKIVSKIKGLYNVVYNKYFVDEFYQYVFVNNLLRFERALAWFDLNVIDGIVNRVARITILISWFKGKVDLYGVDGAVNGVAYVTDYIGGVLRRIQNGLLNYYLYYVVLGAIILFMIKIML